MISFNFPSPLVGEGEGEGEGDMPSDVEQKVKVFLESWNLHGGELDTKASCTVCGRDLVDGKFALVDGVLICLECKGKNQ